MKKSQNLSKLYYNKWLYKIELTVSGGYLLDRTNLTCDWNRLDEIMWSNCDVAVLKDFSDKMQQFSNIDKQVRIENKHVHVFVNEPEQAEKIRLAMEPYLHSVSGPASKQEAEFIKSTNGKILKCDKLPYERYRYRLYITPGRVSPEQRLSLYNWLSKYSLDQVKVAGETARWLQNRRHWIQKPHIYFSDEHMLGLARLFLGNGIQKIEEFSLRRPEVNTWIGKNHASTQLSV